MERPDDNGVGRTVVDIKGLLQIVDEGHRVRIVSNVGGRTSIVSLSFPETAIFTEALSNWILREMRRYFPEIERPPERGPFEFQARGH